MSIGILSLAVLISAILAIIFRQKESTTLYSIFKPLTTLLIISIAVLIFYKTDNTYSSIMIVALLFSLIGDIFLITDKYFLPGLASFLIAHICFIIGFTSLYGFNFNLIPILPLLLIGSVYYNYLRKDLKNYSIPVMVYITVILIMNWQAINLIISSGNQIFYALAMAAILFSFSDAILAYNKFKKPFKFAEPLILSTYWIAIFTFTIMGLYID